jgi:2,4-dienoyl-CoA reductase-like NADH-dependent reductase (Old Yellow Enzyme family)/thioredoxin reductase
MLAPLALAGKTLRNRVVHLSMTTFSNRDAKVGPTLLNYCASRARGGAAMLVTEPISMARHHHLATRADAWNDTDLDGLSRLAHAVESEDCRLIAQLLERGRARNQPGRSFDGIGMSVLPDDLSWSMPRALLRSEIAPLLDEYARAAARLKRCGWSGLEISAGHGHFFHQTLSPWSNRRTDDYGGDLEGRTRLLRELIAAIRAHCGDGFILGLKLPGNDWLPGSIDPVYAAAVARRLTDPAEADAIVADGTAAMVGIGRALIADPAWVTKAQAGRAHDIRYCVSCNTCWERISQQRLPIGCDNNPRVGLADEVDYRPPRAEHARRVVVVGAGPAGLEAAWIAAARGHRVAVLTRGDELGGKLRLRARLPGGESVSSVYDYQHAAAERHGCEFIMRREAGLADVLALEPDAVIIATGADMVAPLWLPEDVRDSELVPDLRTAMREVLRHGGRQPGSAVIFDMDHGEGTYAAAEHLHSIFDRVVIVTPRDTVAQDLPMVVRQGILRRLSEKRISVLTLSEPVWSARLESAAELVCVNVYNGEQTVVRDLAFLAWSTPRAPDAALPLALAERGIVFHRVGDALAARSLHAATSEGHAAGHAV